MDCLKWLRLANFWNIQRFKIWCAKCCYKYPYNFLALLQFVDLAITILTHLIPICSNKFLMYLSTRASAEKFPRGEQRKKWPKNSKKVWKLQYWASSRGPTEKRPKNSKKKHRKIALFTSLYYICTMYENPGGATAPCLPLPTPMFECRQLWVDRHTN